MHENRAIALKAILAFEGGNDDDPRDPGGRTSQGIIQRVYDSYRLRKGQPKQDVFKITPFERDDIYYTQYLAKVRFDELPPGVDLMLADGGVNAGPSQAIKWTQRALGLTADGVLGEVTIQRIQDHPNHDLLIRLSLDRRRAFYRGLKTFPVFGKGWLSRTDQLQKKTQLMAMGDTGPDVVYVPNGNKKATPEDFKKVPSTTTPSFLTGGGAVGSTLSGVQTQLTSFAGTPMIDKVLTTIAIGMAILTAAGLAYTIWATYRKREIEDVLDLVAVQGANDNAEVPQEVLRQYADPAARGGETGNIAEGHTTTSGRKAGDTEDRVNSVEAA